MRMAFRICRAMLLSLAPKLTTWPNTPILHCVSGPIFPAIPGPWAMPQISRDGASTDFGVGRAARQGPPGRRATGHRCSETGQPQNAIADSPWKSAITPCCCKDAFAHDPKRLVHGFRQLGESGPRRPARRRTKPAKQDRDVAFAGTQGGFRSRVGQDGADRGGKELIQPRLPAFQKPKFPQRADELRQQFRESQFLAQFVPPLDDGHVLAIQIPRHVQAPAPTRLLGNGHAKGPIKPPRIGVMSGIGRVLGVLGVPNVHQPFLAFEAFLHHLAADLEAALLRLPAVPAEHLHLGRISRFHSPPGGSRRRCPREATFAAASTPRVGQIARPRRSPQSSPAVGTTPPASGSRSGRKRG